MSNPLRELPKVGQSVWFDQMERKLITTGHLQQMIDNDVLVPLDDGMLTINSPIWVDGSAKVKPGAAPGIGQHSDEILRSAGYDDASIGRLRAAGAVA